MLQNEVRREHLDQGFRTATWARHGCKPKAPANGCDKAGALQWLVAARLIAPPAGPGRTPAARRRPGGAPTPPAPPAPALALPTAPKPAPTAAVAAAILAAAVPADDTPARAV